MCKLPIRILVLFLLLPVCSGKGEELNYLVSQKYPQAEDLQIVSWGAWEEGAPCISQVVVLQTGNQGPAKILWQSALDSAYSPKIRFLEEMALSGIPIALVERQTGAAAAQMDVLGKISGHFRRLSHIDGTRFDVERLDSTKPSCIVAHQDENILDVPEIYCWRQNRFVEESALHPDYYRKLLNEDKTKLPSSMSAIALVHLSKIAILSGNLAQAKRIAAEALSKERANGKEANQSTLGEITKLLNDLKRYAR
jgi:hypothetical protein